MFKTSWALIEFRPIRISAIPFELKEKTVIMLIAIFPSLIVNIIANNLFLPKFGVLATANAAFISALTYCVTTFFYSVYSMNKVKKYK